jgi:hypothetical protein
VTCLIHSTGRSPNAIPVCSSPSSSSLPLPADSTLVEGQLLALQDVAVAATTLAGPAGDDGVQTTGLELALDGGLDLALLLEALALLLDDALALLDLLLGGATGGLLLPATADGLAVVGLVPLTEGRGVDLDDGGLGQGVGADQLVVGRVEGDGDDADLAGDALATPSKVARVEAQGAELAVAAAGADEMDALGADTGIGGLAALLECPALGVRRRIVRGAIRVMHTSSCDSMRA